MKIIDRILRIKQRDWYDITLGQFNELQALGKNPTLRDVVQVVYGVDINTIPVSEVGRYSVSFLNTDIPKSPIRELYVLNGRRYTACFDLTKITTAQFYDFRNYAKKDDFVGILSCCMIQEGSEYGSGDMAQVRADIESMRITDALTVSFFFKNQLVVLLRCTLSYSTQTLRGLKDKSLQEILDKIDELDLSSLISCR